MAGKVRKYDRSSRLVSTLIVTLIGLVFVLPLVWMLSASLQINGDIFKYPFTWLPHAPRWVNYADIWNSGEVPLLQMYRNSLFIVIFTNIGVLFVSLLAAYAFARIEFKGKGIVFGLFIGVMMIPSQVTVVPRFLLFKELNIYNTLWAVILPGLFSVTSIFLMRQFFMTIPASLSESAFLDGAGHFRILMQIMLPLLKPTVASLVIMNFVSCWNDYFNPLVFLPSKKWYTVSLGIQYYYTQEVPSTNLTMAMSVCAILPVLILFFSCQRFFIESITSSGVKG